ncbi:hypothetical protein NI17_004915 [Thermobifida halotolerans]|uniref:Beta-ketoacyl-[acyl-carrier-protein] synthase III N-terminal domain-containing protein n=1 Tax=Thermobifida halotolerans TaxID=483545 RepID=A0AA97M4Q2_9ACTN|nr:hypothetical protein [Thermobifida halotolerans]UOE20564.1 hypothetical protein NI17_004915 [Thermobifida halotolerans]
MGTVIRATAVSTDPAVHSSVDHSALAAEACIERAGITPDQVDLLINTGVYRDRNMSEPAMAALVQQRLGINPDHVRFPTARPALSFDLMNGACGVLDAVRVGADFITTGSAEYVLVVSGDAHPSNDPERARATGFPYATMGAAMLLERSPREDAGFGRVHSSPVSADAAPLVEGYTDSSRMGADGRGTVTVRRAPETADVLADLAAATVRACAEAQRVDLRAALLVASQPHPGFPAEVAARLGLPADAAATATGVDGDPHTSALTLAYHQAAAAGRVGDRPVVFVAVGAGPACSCAVYRPADPAPR